MTYTATFFSYKRGLLTATVEAASELEARQAAAKVFGIRSHIGRIEIKAKG